MYPVVLVAMVPIPLPPFLLRDRSQRKLEAQTIVLNVLQSLGIVIDTASTAALYVLVAAGHCVLPPPPQPHIVCSCVF